MWFVNCEQRFFQIFWVKEMYMGYVAFLA